MKPVDNLAGSYQGSASACFFLSSIDNIAHGSVSVSTCTGKTYLENVSLDLCTCKNHKSNVKETLNLFVDEPPSPHSFLVSRPHPHLMRYSH